MQHHVNTYIESYGPRKNKEEISLIMELKIQKNSHHNVNETERLYKLKLLTAVLK